MKNKKTKAENIDNPFDDLFFWFSIASVGSSCRYFNKNKKAEPLIEAKLNRYEKEDKK